jgi:GT2 family glycosyltransferase
MALRSVQGLRETTEGHDVEIVCAVDHDPETAERLKHFVTVLDYSDGYRGCSKAWNDALACATGDPIVFAADDLIWQAGWLDAALAALDEHPGHLIGFNDGHWGAELSTHYLLPRDFIIEVLGGRVAWEGYKHSFNDLETCERARRAGRYHWCEEARVYHEHWLFGDRQQDETDTRRLPDHPQDQRIYNDRRTAGFPDDLEPVIEC